MGMEEFTVSIHTLHELEARNSAGCNFVSHWMFPFIRFTNWKQVSYFGETYGGDAVEVFPFIRFTNWKQGADHFPQYLEEMVSIHTLHELEASRG